MTQQSHKNKLFLVVATLTLLVLPTLASAAFPIPYWPSESQPIITCGGTDCNLCELINTSQNVISFAMTLLIAVFAPIMLVYGGVMIMISRGSPEAFEKGKKAFTGAIIGIVIGLGAFLIINEFVNLLGINLGHGTQKSWYEFDCPTNIIPKPTPPQTSGGNPPPGSEDCPDCKTIPDVDCKSGVSCQAQPQVIAGLTCIGNQSGIRLRITEGYPPTYTKHKSAAHRNGCAVDATVPAGATCSQINNLVGSIASSCGMSGLNEYYIQCANNGGHNTEFSTGEHIHLVAPNCP